MNLNKDLCLKAIEFRHACKTFCKKKRIDDEEMRFILEAGRMAPSSFGMEGWKFLVITNQELKEKLRPLCWNQAQITTCSHLVVILAAVDALRPSSGIPQKRFARRRLPKEKEEAYIKLYSEFMAEEIADDDKMFAWSSKQTYLAAMQMMLAAASIEIDSCPIEGFEREKVEELLDIDNKQYRVSLLLPFGYRIYPQSEHLRRDFDEIVEFII